MPLLQGLGDARKVNCIAKSKRLHFYLKHSNNYFGFLYRKKSKNYEVKLSPHLTKKWKKIKIWKNLSHVGNNVDKDWINSEWW